MTCQQDSQRLARATRGPSQSVFPRCRPDLWPVSSERTIDITVSVPTHNNSSMLRAALESLLAQDTSKGFSFEIIVIDDGSTDDTSGIAKELESVAGVAFRYSWQAGGGVAKARNRSVELAKGTWVAFFDDDQVADPSWLQELLATAVSYDADCVGGNRDLVAQAGAPIPRNHAIRTLLGEESYDGEFQVTSFRDLPGTGACLVKKSVLQALGGFDEAMLCGGSDFDFFRKALAFGHRVFRNARALVHHVIPAYRLRPDYLRRVSYRTGANFAYIDRRVRGLGMACLYSMCRIGQVVMVHVPLLLRAKVMSRPADALGRRCLIWRCAGYARQVLAFTGCGHWADAPPADGLAFRGERQLFRRD